MGRRAKRGRRLHGILLLDKPPGRSSNQALQKVRWLYDAQKAGHTGSLDPLATGMLPICFGEATKLGGYLLDADKAYETTLCFGVTTHSGDADGDVLERRSLPSHTVDQFVAICETFQGAILQVPPMVSALKVNGQRLYKLAREGITIERKPRSITISKLKVLSYNAHQARLEVHCSKGTYIRSLVTDVGEAMGCGAHITALHRTFVSPFEANSMVTVDELEAMQSLVERDQLLLPIDAGLKHLSAVTLSDSNVTAFQQGQAIHDVPVETSARLIDSPCRVYSQSGRLLGLAKYELDGKLEPRRVIQWD